jgi:hypothetical protein
VPATLGTQASPVSERATVDDFVLLIPPPQAASARAPASEATAKMVCRRRPGKATFPSGDLRPKDNYILI